MMEPQDTAGSVNKTGTCQQADTRRARADSPNVLSTTRDGIEAGSDLTDAEIEACKLHLRARMKTLGSLRGCISYCQRNMGIGWSHSQRIIEYLEACGFLASYTAGSYDPGPNWY
jgi:hypothetical protein